MPGRDEGGGTLLERDRELERIAQGLRRSRGGQGSALVVEGPAGIGKSAILLASRDTAVSEGFRVLRARGSELEREYAFGVVRQLFEPMLAEAPEDDRDSLLQGAPGLAARLLGFPGTTVGAEAPDPSFAILHGLYWLCANLAAERPLALIVDDAHWADSASLRFLAFLLPRLEELRLVVLLAARSAEAGTSEELLIALTMDPAAEILTLKPLTPGAVARLVALSLGAEPDPSFAEACWGATGGTPFLVHALVSALLDEGIEPVAASTASVPAVATAALGRWALLRLNRLGPDAARLARAVAILERAEVSAAARLAGLAPGDATSAAELLVHSGVLQEQPLAFVHPILRAAVYQEIGPADRSEAHRLAARLLAEGHGSPARITEHLLATRPAGDGWVVEQLRAAAAAATASGAPESTAVYLRRALAEPPAPEVTGGLLQDLGLAEYNAGQEGWQRHLEAALAAATDDASRTSIALQLAMALFLSERLGEAIEVLDRVAGGLDASEEEALLVLHATAVGCGLLDAATAPSVADRARALVALAKKQPVPRVVLAVAAYGAALANEPSEQVAELARRAVAAGVRPLPDPGEPPWFASAAMALIFAERNTEARTLLKASLTEARATANTLILPRVLAQQALLELRCGDLTAAEEDARSLLDPDRLPAPLIHRLLTTGVLVLALVERGALEEAESAVEPATTYLQMGSVSVAHLRLARGRLRLAQRRYREALMDFQAAGEIAMRIGAASPSYLPWRSQSALAHLALGEIDAARRLSGEELELARAFGAPRTLGVALRAAGLVGGGRGESLLREAIGVLDGPDNRVEQAHALTDLGALLRRSNHRMEARKILGQALDAAHRARAGLLANRAETELRATGARPRRLLLTGLEALTTSERRIAELAAEGMTNPEIAQHLFITARTVEGHLTGVFQKLGIEFRTELPAALNHFMAPGGQVFTIAPRS